MGEFFAPSWLEEGQGKTHACCLRGRCEGASAGILPEC